MRDGGLQGGWYWTPTTGEAKTARLEALLERSEAHRSGREEAETIGAGGCC